MGILGNLGRIVAAPVKVIDKTMVEPLAEIADTVVKELGGDD